MLWRECIDYINATYQARHMHDRVCSSVHPPLLIDALASWQNLSQILSIASDKYRTRACGIVLKWGKVRPGCEQENCAALRDASDLPKGT